MAMRTGCERAMANGEGDEKEGGTGKRLTGPRPSALWSVAAEAVGVSIALVIAGTVRCHQKAKKHRIERAPPPLPTTRRQKLPSTPPARRPRPTRRPAVPSRSPKKSPERAAAAAADDTAAADAAGSHRRCGVARSGGRPLSTTWGSLGSHGARTGSGWSWRTSPWTPSTSPPSPATSRRTASTTPGPQVV